MTEQKCQTLILAHRQELIEQAAKHCSNAYPDKSIDIEMGALHASGLADITIASVQSLTSKDRMNKFDPNRFKLVLVDEAHHIVAAGYMKTLEHFGLSTFRPESPALVGVSATFSRLDGLRLGAAIDHVVYHKDYIDMIGDKWLSDVIFTTVESTADISKVKRGTTGDFQASELSRAVNTSRVNEITVRSWLAKAQGRQSTLVFCVDLAHVAALTKAFRAIGVDAQFVTGDTHKAERSALLDAFRNREFPVLLNCGVFTEGTDIPNVDCVLLARPTRSRNLLVQMIGRGMRLYPGKENCHVIDMVASLNTGIVSTPTLFGLDPSELVDNARVDDLKAMKDRRDAEATRRQSLDSVPELQPQGNLPGTVTFTDYDSVFDLLEDTSGERHIRALSPHAWVEVGQNRFILASANGAFLNLERVVDEATGQSIYVVRETRPITGIAAAKSPYMTPREITRSENFTHALRGADTYAKEKYPFRFVSRKQPWRDGPPTEGQLAFLNKFRPKDDPFTVNSISKGRAGDMITKIKHGARGRFAQLEVRKKRAIRAKAEAEDEQALRRREEVKVGPLN